MSRNVVGAFGPDAGSLSTRIQGSEKKSMIGAFFGAVFITIIPLLFFWHMHMPLFLKPGIPNPVVGMVLLFGGLLFCRALWEAARLKRFGDPVLDLAQVPVPLGGKVEGRVNLGRNYLNAPEFALKLQCLRLITQSNGKSNTTTEKVLWSGESKTSLLPGGLVPVSVAIPDDQLQTNNDNPLDRIMWRLTVTAPFPGIKFFEKYEIPVLGSTSPARHDPSSSPGGNSPAATPKTLFLATLPFLIVGIGIWAGGFYLLTFGLADVTKAGASAHWPNVAGNITGSTPPSNRAVYGPLRIVYRYDINGVTHTADTIYPHLFWKASVGRQMANTYPISAPVTVYYSPDNPANACLVPGLRAGAFQRLVVALLVLAIGFLFASSAIFAPKYGVMTGNTISYRKGTPASSISGYTCLLVFILAAALWFVS